MRISKLSTVALFFALALGRVCVPFAAAAQIAATPVTVQLNMSVGESLALSVGTPSLSFTYTQGSSTIAPQTFNLVSTWALQASRTRFDVNWYFSSATAALSGPANIPAADVYSNMNGSSYSACNAAADSIVPGDVSGAACNVGIAQAIGVGTLSGTRTDVIGIEFQNLPTNLAAGSYTGVLNISAGTLN